MASKKNTSGLAEYTADLKRKKEKDVIKAIDKLRKSDKPFTLANVCKEANVSRSYFTKHPEMMTLVNKYRKPTGYKTKQTKDAKDTLIISLRAENMKLKKQIKEFEAQENYKIKYENALARIDELEKQLNSAYSSTMNLDF